MLVGPSYKPILPRAPEDSTGLAGIFAYLRQFDRAINSFFSTVTANSSGLIGTSGISALGDRAQNLRGSVSITGTATNALVTFTSMELNASYFLTLGSRPGVGTAPLVYPQYLSMTATGFSIHVSAAPGSGNSSIVDWHLIR